MVSYHSSMTAPRSKVYRTLLVEAGCRASLAKLAALVEAAS
jgi:hypothetical protein